MATLDLGNVMGPQGPQGEQGEVGPQGPQGPQGEQGPPVDTSTLIAKSEKGAANGVATLDSSGKLVQMPTAADVGARASDWLPSAAEIEAVPASEKGTANGVATLDGSGKLVQMPTATDVGLSEVNNEFTQGLVSSSSPTRQLGYIWSGTVRALFQTFSLPVPSSGWSQLGTSGIYVVDTEVNWSFGWPFVSKPVVLLQPSGINYRLIQVKVGDHDQNGISSVQLYSYTDSFAGPASVMAIIFGEVDSHSQ